MWFEHIKALLVLGWTFLVLYGTLWGEIPYIQPHLYFATSVITGFYFGERHSPLGAKELI